MSRVPQPNELLTSSLLDRLTDLPSAPQQRLSDLRKSVRGDLEDLLNTRWRCTTTEEVSPLLQASLINYGLPDFSGGNLQGAQEPDKVRAAVTSAIERFEPRLQNARVKIVKNESSVDRTLRLQIEAVLHVEPWNERVRFNTIMEAGTGRVTVQAVE